MSTPPKIGIRDLGSSNGTYVNGKKIHHRPRELTDPQSPNTVKSLHKLKNGDEIQIGNTVLKVVIEVDSNESKTENISAIQEQK